MLDISCMTSFALMTEHELKEALSKQTPFIQNIFMQNNITQFNNLFNDTNQIAYKNTVFQC